MTQPAAVCPSDIRAFLTANPKLRARDAADAMGISEAQLVAASVGHGTTRVAAHPDRIIPAAERLGEVMRLRALGPAYMRRWVNMASTIPGNMLR